ncbi:SGNH/GDSL hydrolase family protein [Streptomyces roseolilacinus]|uniref:Hydrolase n=1 Tax=Streptomyces roseolilacinus TaxID=66904 RepID=A0A918B9J7_9ACTN|nr:SGNH/GDSL hydrolase family protein [Streptomyces roseolilacinus]GGQ33565.1 hydrolase [Streptomyces roseolilacinus]
MISRSRAALTAFITVSALATPSVIPTASAADSEPLHYVAMGDSFAAAPLVLPIDPSNLLCLRSLADYPHIAAKALGAKLTDVSCSGATTEDFSAPQHSSTAPQYNALNQDTDIVSITIGGNDTGLVAATLNCVNLLPKPFGKSCAAEYTKSGVDTLKSDIDTWASTFNAALSRVNRLAPNADIFIIGYGNYIRPGGCFPTQPLWDVDATYIQETVDHLSTTLKKAARTHGATYVDTYSLGIGHDTCAAPVDKYIEGLLPTRIAAPLHPNAAGSRAIGEALATAVRNSAGTR